VSDRTANLTSCNRINPIASRGASMKLSTRLPFFLICLIVSRVALAQTPATAGSSGSNVAQLSTPEADKTDLPFLSASGARVGQGIGLETSLLWPIYPGYLFHLRATVPVAFDGRGQLLLGAQGHIPHDRAAEGRFSTLAAHIGFRTYLWKGLHIDAMTNLGVGRIRGSVVDGKDYDSFDAELLAVAGWRFEAGPVYALVQPLGIGAVVYRSNPWEIVGEGRKTTEPPIFVGNVLLGMQF
jgi:hypothetical protein